MDEIENHPENIELQVKYNKQTKTVLFLRVVKSQIEDKNIRNQNIIMDEN